MALVLTRRLDEAILLAGGEIRITVARIGPETVRLAIDAPRDIDIVREELAWDPAAVAEQCHAADRRVVKQDTATIPEVISV